MAIPVVSTIVIERIQVIAKNVIKVQFTSPVAASPSLINPLSYSITPITHPNKQIEVTAVLAIEDAEDATTDSILLRMTPHAEWETSYTLEIPSAGTVPSYPSEADIPEVSLFTPSGEPLAKMTMEWSHYRTKVDSVISNLSSMYDTNVGTTLFHILAAIGLSDEQIGGDVILQIIQ